MAQSLTGGLSYSATDVSIEIAGLPLGGVKSITIKETQERPNNYGIGSANPVSRGSGKKEFTCSMDIDYKTTLLLRNTAGGSLTDLRRTIGLFPILVTLDNKEPGGIRKLLVNGAEFISDGFEMAVDDTEAVMSYDMSIASITYL